MERALSGLGFTQGTLYHYFPSKSEFAVAVIDERIAPEILARWSPVLDSPDPVESLCSVLAATFLSGTADDLALGCPLLKVAEEVDDGTGPIHDRVKAAFDAWRRLITSALQQGLARASVDPRIDCEAEADFFVASLEGCLALAKATRHLDVLPRTITRLISYLQTLRVIA